MSQISERFVTPVSDAELARRWRAVRALMEAERLDALVIENNNNSTGGYVQWFTGVPTANGMPLAAVFPLTEDMTVVSHGGLDGRRDLAGGSDGVFRGVKTVLSTAYFPAVNYTSTYESALLVQALAPYKSGRIGLVSPYQMLYATVNRLKTELPDAVFSDASELVDTVKVVKSAEEIEMVRRAAAIQDAAFEAALAAAEPGKTDREIAAVAQSRSVELGSDQGFVLCGSAPVGSPAHFGPFHLQGRIIREGDVLSILVENSGPGGMWSELGRTIVLGKAPQQMVEDVEFALQAQTFTLEQMVPGAAARDVWEAYLQYMRENGRPEERRIHCHGQGYDLVERPLIRYDETLPIMASLNIACHPNFDGKLAFCSICDGFLLTADRTERLHKTEQRIFEL